MNLNSHGYRRTKSQIPNAPENQVRSRLEVSQMAGNLDRTAKLITQVEYIRKPTAPAIMERDSNAAYKEPWVATVSTRDARATEGAAPNKPAKLFGFRMVPKVENAETNSPPIRKRIRSVPSTGAS